MTPRDALIAHAVACREARMRGYAVPSYEGPPLVGDIDMTGLSLSDINLRGMDLRCLNLTETDLRDANLSGSHIRGVYLTSADLRGADLIGAYLVGAYLRGAHLCGADLSGAYLRDADLRDTDLRSAKAFGGTIVRHTAGLDGGYHWHAYVTEHATILRYGCDRAHIDKWLKRDASYGLDHLHDLAHWATGPAVAIAAAVALRDGGAK